MPRFYNDLYVEKWIKEHRIPDFGPLDMKAMAKNFNMKIVFKDLLRAKGYLVPSAKFGYTIEIDTKDSYSERLFTFAHEIGHYFTITMLGWTARYYNEGAHADCELFCDWFARELLLPKRWLDSAPFTDLYASYIAISDLCVSEETFLLQLMAQGDISPQFKMSSDKILCLVCCNYEYYRRSCSCQPQREDIRNSARLQRDSQLMLPLNFKY